MHEPKQ